MTTKEIIIRDGRVIETLMGGMFKIEFDEGGGSLIGTIASGTYTTFALFAVAIKSTSERLKGKSI